MYSRHITPKLTAALQDTPVVFLNGARQTGKSTLVKEIAKAHNFKHYITLDNLSILAAVKADPQKFIQNYSDNLIIDEVQRVPDLFLAIKEEVDKKRIPGKFLLTGSANVRLLPQVSDSLAGRMEIITLWPLSQGEINSVQETFIDTVFSDFLSVTFNNPVSRETLLQKIIMGGYPEIVGRSSAERRYEWFESYITSILQRDIRELANISDLTVFPKLMSLLATRSSSLLNNAELSRASGISHTTLLRYMTLLQTTFLIFTALPWSNNLGKRLVKTPKIYVSDTGILAHLLGIDDKRLQSDQNLIGPLLENFVVMELKKQMGWNKTRARIFHYRTPNGQEVDIILEDSAGRCVGIEVKASATVSQKDFKALAELSEQLGNKFHRGLVLYLGDEILPFGKNLYAMPVSTLWQNH